MAPASSTSSLPRTLARAFALALAALWLLGGTVWAYYLPLPVRHLKPAPPARPAAPSTRPPAPTTKPPAPARPATPTRPPPIARPQPAKPALHPAHGAPGHGPKRTPARKSAAPLAPPRSGSKTP